MAAQVRFKQYTLSDSQGQSLVTSDFAGAVSVKQDLFATVAGDLIDFTLPTSELPLLQLRSFLSLSVGAEQFQLERDFVSKKTTIHPQADVNTLPSPTGIFHIGNELLKLRLKLLLATPKKILPGQLDAVKKQAVTLGAGVETESLIKTVSDHAALESELNAQKQSDELHVFATTVETKLKAVTEKLESVKTLSTKLMALDKGLGNLGHLKGKDLKGESVKLKQEIYQGQTDELQRLAKAEANSPNGEEAKEKPGVMGKILFGFLIILLLAGFIGYAVTKDGRLLAAAVVGALFELVLLVSVNMLPASADIDKQLLLTSLEANQKRGIKQTLRETVSRASKFFVDKAWLDAMLHERELLQASMKARLGEDADVAKLVEERQALLVETVYLKSLLRGEQNIEIPPLEYARKKRELEMLNIDRERQEAEVSRLPNAAQILELISKASGAVGGALELAPELALPYSQVRISGEQIEFFSSETNTWVASEKEEVLFPAFISFAIAAWELNPIAPLILSAEVAQKIGARISKLQTIGQVIVINQVN